MYLEVLIREYWPENGSGGKPCKDVGESPIITRVSPASFEESPKFLGETLKSPKYPYGVYRMLTIKSDGMAVGNV